jgi:hypothetical protein
MGCGVERTLFGQVEKAKREKAEMSNKPLFYGQLFKITDAGLRASKTNNTQQNILYKITITLKITRVKRLGNLLKKNALY